MRFFLAKYKPKSNKPPLHGLFLLGFLLLITALPSPALEVITHPKNTDQLKALTNLRSIFSMRTLYWPNGKRIKVIVLPDDHPLHKRFVKEKLHLFPHQLRRAWNRKTYTGTGQAPITVHSIPEMQTLVNQTKNSIGYIDRERQYE
jgi:ABC-type phosphate transport system substrate-binding protein